VRASLVSLGRIPFAEANAAQSESRERVIAGGGPVVFTVEHDPVYTIGRAGVRREFAPGDPRRWPSVHAPEHPVVELDRGGDVTYHGPGQLVMYPVLPLKRIGLSLVGYVRALERSCIAALAKWGVGARAREGLTGVWVDVKDGGAPSKIAAIGVGSRRWVTYHGIAVNVSTDLGAFDHVTPCGIAECRVTSVEKLVDAPPTVEEFGRALARSLAEEVGLDLDEGGASGRETSVA